MKFSRDFRIVNPREQDIADNTPTLGQSINQTSYSSSFKQYDFFGHNKALNLTIKRQFHKNKNAESIAQWQASHFTV